jgi:hypothetical protein
MVSRGWPRTETHAATDIAAGHRLAIDLRERQPLMAPVILFGSVIALVLVLSAVHAVWGAFRPT